MSDDAKFGMIGDEWHGPNPPGPDWVKVSEGPRGGGIWKHKGGGGGSPQQTQQPQGQQQAPPKQGPPELQGQQPQAPQQQSQQAPQPQSIDELRALTPEQQKEALRARLMAELDQLSPEAVFESLSRRIAPQPPPERPGEGSTPIEAPVLLEEQKPPQEAKKSTRQVKPLDTTKIQSLAAGVPQVSGNMPMDKADTIIAAGEKAAAALTVREFEEWAKVIGIRALGSGTTKAAKVQEFKNYVNRLAVSHGQTQFSIDAPLAVGESREHFGTEPPGEGWTYTGDMRWVKERPDLEGDGPRIAVIGGGPGGLFATYILNLVCPQARITLFESSSRLGGKIRTDRFSDGTPFEAGVAELYEYLGPHKDPLRLLIEDELDLPTVQMSGGGVILGEDVLRDLDDVEEKYGTDTRKQVERFHKRCSELMSLERYTTRWQPDNSHPWANKTFHECIHQECSDCTACCYLKTAVHSDLATEPWTCNGLNGIKNVLMDNDRYMQLYHVKGGIGRIAKALGQKIVADVRLDCRVHTCQKAGDRYRLSFRSNQRDSEDDFDCVISCLPNHWLHCIDWTEESLKEAIASICEHYDLPAHYLRVSCLFRTAFWERLGLPGEFWMMDMLGGCCCYNESARWKSKKGHVLSWLLAGQAALNLVSQNQSDECIIEGVLDALPDCLRAGACREFVEGQVDRYVGSINAQPGGWPAPELEGLHQPDPAGCPGVFLTCDAFFDSTLNAALISARTAVAKLMGHLGIEMEAPCKFLEQLEPDEATLSVGDMA